MKTQMRAIIALFIVVCGVAAHAGTGGGIFNSHELSLSVFGGYVDKDDSDLAPGAGLSYYFTENFGVGAVTHWENYSGTFFDNVAAEGYFRWPLSSMPLAPYAVVSLGYSFETSETFAAFGGGAEWRFDRKWGAFGDLRWQVNDDTDNGVAIRIGIRYVF